MNQRIKELAEQQGFTGPNYLISSQELEKFAELIIRECIQQCENIGKIAEQTNYGEMARKTKATTNGCAQMIKWRFGVE